jgi:hypothetical protein
LPLTFTALPEQLAAMVHLLWQNGSVSKPVAHRLQLLDALKLDGQTLQFAPVQLFRHEQLQPRGPELPLTLKARPEQFAAIVHVR